MVTKIGFHRMVPKLNNPMDAQRVTLRLSPARGGPHLWNVTGWDFSLTLLTKVVHSLQARIQITGCAGPPKRPAAQLPGRPAARPAAWPGCLARLGLARPPPSTRSTILEFATPDYNRRPQKLMLNP